MEAHEPSLRQLLADPSVRHMLRGDGVDAEQIWLLRQLAMRHFAATPAVE